MALSTSPKSSYPLWRMLNVNLGPTCAGVRSPPTVLSPRRGTWIFFTTNSHLNLHCMNLGRSPWPLSYRLAAAPGSDLRPILVLQYPLQTALFTSPKTNYPLWRMLNVNLDPTRATDVKNLVHLRFSVTKGSSEIQNLTFPGAIINQAG